MNRGAVEQAAGEPTWSSSATRWPGRGPRARPRDRDRGGSVLDLDKAIAASLANPRDPLDYLEVIGRGQPLTRRSAPCIAVPTTVGRAAEVTWNASSSRRATAAREPAQPSV